MSLAEKVELKKYALSTGTESFKDLCSLVVFSDINPRYQVSAHIKPLGMTKT